MGDLIVTVVDATVDPGREADLLEGFQQLKESARPDGLLRSELLRGQDGAWRVQTTWRDFDSLMAVRKSGQRPAAIDLLDGVGATHTHGWFVVAAAFEG